jgi:hypothetical protein
MECSCEYAESESQRIIKGWGEENVSQGFPRGSILCNAIGKGRTEGDVLARNHMRARGVDREKKNPPKYMLNK